MHTVGFSIFVFNPELFFVMAVLVENFKIIFGVTFLLFVVSIILMIIGKHKLSVDEKNTFEYSYVKKLSSENKNSIFETGKKAFIYKILSLIFSYSTIVMFILIVNVSENTATAILLLAPVVLICFIVFFIKHCRRINQKTFDIYTYRRIKNEKKENFD